MKQLSLTSSPFYNATSQTPKNISLSIDFNTLDSPNNHLNRNFHTKTAQESSRFNLDGFSPKSKSNLELNLQPNSVTNKTYNIKQK